jgi:tripartite-type tricarboxylate transporter receptor subunit TctC
MLMMRPRLVLYAALFAGAFWPSIAPADDSVADFYRGRTINHLLATTPGGSWDVYLRVLLKHLGNHIPGRPNIVLQYMPGAGGVKMLEYMHSVAPKDGTVIATPLPTSLHASALSPLTANFKPAQFNWIGSLARIQDVISVWHENPVKTIDDARKMSAKMGVTGTGSNTYFDIAMANNLLGTKFQPVQGYRGSVEIDLAIERREVDGRANTWDGWAAAKPDWLKAGLVIQLVQIGRSKLPEIGDVPLFSELVSAPEDKRLVEFLSAGIAVGRTVFMPPDVPIERVEAVRRAFQATMEDPAYIVDSKARNLTVGESASGQEIQDLVTKAFAASSALIDRANKVLTIH